MSERVHPVLPPRLRPLGRPHVLEHPQPALEAAPGAPRGGRGARTARCKGGAGQHRVEDAGTERQRLRAARHQRTAGARRRARTATPTTISPTATVPGGRSGRSRPVPQPRSSTRPRRRGQPASPAREPKASTSRTRRRTATGLSRHGMAIVARARPAPRSAESRRLWCRGSRWRATTGASHGDSDGAERTGGDDRDRPPGGPQRGRRARGPRAGEAFRAFEADPALRWRCCGARAACSAPARTSRRAAPSRADPVGPRATARWAHPPAAVGKPAIAAVAGHAVAGGLELSLRCDLRVASDDAVFGVFCRRWGVPLLDGGTVRLPRLIGAPARST